MKAENLIRWINNELKERGMSQRELARRAGLSSATVPRVLSGETYPTFEFCLAVSEPLGRTPIELFLLADLITEEEAAYSPKWLMEARHRQESGDRLVEAKARYDSGELTLQEIYQIVKALDIEDREALLDYALWKKDRSTTIPRPSESGT